MKIAFPSRAYLQVFDGGRFGLVIGELAFGDAGDIEKAAQSVGSETVAFRLLEDGKLFDASEEVALKWVKLNSDDIEFEDGIALVPQFIRDHASDALNDLASEIAASKAAA